MTNVYKQLILAGLLASLGFAAAAQTPTAATGAAPAPIAAREELARHDPARFQKMQEHRAEHMAKRMVALKQKLQINSAQEGAWSTYTAALKPPSFTRPDRAEMARLTTPERIDRMRALRATRMAEMDKRADATKTFYASLAPEQKKTFEELTAQHGFHGDRHGRHHRG